MLCLRRHDLFRPSFMAGAGNRSMHSSGGGTLGEQVCHRPSKFEALFPSASIADGVTLGPQ